MRDNERLVQFEIGKRNCASDTVKQKSSVGVETVILPCGMKISHGDICLEVAPKCGHQKSTESGRIEV